MIKQHRAPQTLLSNLNGKVKYACVYVCVSVGVYVCVYVCVCAVPPTIRILP